MNFFMSVLDSFKLLLHLQTSKGVEKYGVQLTADRHAEQSWTRHAAEELVDAFQYIQMAEIHIQRLEQRITELEAEVNEFRTQKKV